MFPSIRADCHLSSAVVDDAACCSLLVADSNALLTTNGFTMPTAMKTGTTIAGIIFAGGVVLGAGEGTATTAITTTAVHVYLPLLL